MGDEEQGVAEIGSLAELADQLFGAQEVEVVTDSVEASEAGSTKTPSPKATPSERSEAVTESDAGGGGDAGATDGASTALTSTTRPAGLRLLQQRRRERRGDEGLDGEE